MTDRIDTAIDPVKLAGRDSAVDLVFRQPDIQQLTTRDHAVLSSGQGRNSAADQVVSPLPDIRG